MKLLEFDFRMYLMCCNEKRGKETFHYIGNIIRLDDGRIIYSKFFDFCDIGNDVNTFEVYRRITFMRYIIENKGKGI
jgi:hypothetical protein